MQSFLRSIDIASRMRSPLARWTLTILLVLCSGIGYGQSGAGSIQGTVTDASGGVLPGASVRVMNTATGVASATVVNRVGFYEVPGLFTGTYEVDISAPGMKTYTTRLELLVAQNAVINPVLNPDTVVQQITVNADLVQLTSMDSGSVTSTLENDRINQLPMNVRLLSGLIGQTTPEIVMQGGTQPRVNGLLTEALEYTIDGVPTNNDFFGGPYNEKVASMDPDSVQEVRMETTSSGAQLAAPATGIITTKSGTNKLHGSFFETARNNAVGVAKSRSDPSNYAAPHYVRNEFGANAGGPVIIPHLYNGKNRTFWFFAYERYSFATDKSTLYKVPTMAMRQGDFSGLINGKGILQTLYDPSTTANSTKCAATGAANAYCRTPFSGNQIPVAQMSPTAKIYYDLMPVPTSTANPLVTSNLTSLNHSFQILPQETFRLDHAFSENDRAYIRFTDQISDTNTSGGPRSVAADGIAAGAAEGYTNGPLGSDLASASYTHIFSPTFFAETILSQQWFFFTNATGAEPEKNYEAMLGLPNNFGETGFPALGNGNLINNFSSSQTTQHESQATITVDENLTKTLGRNQLQFGMRFRTHRGTIHPAGLTDAIGFGANPTAIYNPASGKSYSPLSNTGYADASFFLGSAATYSVTHQAYDVNFRFKEVAGYLQDNYHLNRNLTVNVGLRYESHPAPAWSGYNLANSFDLKNDAMVFATPVSTLVAKGFLDQAAVTNDQNIGVKFETADQAGMPGGTLMKSYNLNFLPRAGFAYQLFGGRRGTVLRGAYGRYAYLTPLTYFITGPAKNNPIVTSYSQSYATAAQSVDGNANELLRYNDPVKFGVMGKNTTNVVDSTSTTSILPGIGLYSVSPDWPPSFVTEGNLTIEQPLKGNSALRASLIWTHASNLDMSMNYNNQPSNYQWEMTTGTPTLTGGASVIGTPQQNTYSATGMRPYDRTTWGANSMHVKSGWSNYQALELNYQRLFHHGVAYQISYVQSHAMNVGGDQSFGADPAANYPGVLGTVATMTSPYGTPYPGVAPPALPANTAVWAHYHAMDKYQGYGLTSAIPAMQIKFNGILDLPFGRNKRYFSQVNRFVDELIGGFQIAGSGNVHSQVFQPSAGLWGATNPVHIYKHKYPVTDCRSGVCQKSYMWYNGYLAPTVTTGLKDSVCTSNCVTGLPADYVPMQVPIDNTPGTTYYGDDEVLVSSPAILASNGGSPQAMAYDAGPQGSGYMEKSWVNGPTNWTADISLFKVFPVTRKTNLRVNVDAFNAFNVQGWNNPGTGGLEGRLSSYNSPREIQLTMRFTF